MGEMPYGDFDMLLTDNDPNYDLQVDEQLRYLTASGINAQQTVVDPNTITRYFHGDLIDSTMLTTDPNSAATASLAYTAFGEPIGDPNELNTRYQYADGYGYESDLLTLDGVPGSAPITLQHVGARWYQPDIGRFVQRDLIGIRGGFNLYLYCVNNPLTCIDPAGLYWDYDDVLDKKGFVTRHYYDRGWTGLFKNEYQYSVTVPPGKLPPAPPRTPDVRCVAIIKSTALGADMGFGLGLGIGAFGGPEAAIVGGITGYVTGFVTGFIGGVVTEFIE